MSNMLRFVDDLGRRYPTYEEVSISDVAILLSGHNKLDEPDGVYYDLTMGSISEEGNLILKGKSSDIKDLLRKGDLITPTRGQQKVGWKIIGITYVIDRDNTYTGGNCTFIIRPGNRVNSVYLSYAMNSPTSVTRKFIIKETFGTSQMMIRKDGILTAPLSLPSLPEQKKIADFLGALDDHIELQEKKLSLLKEQKRGYLQRIFA